MAVCVWWLVIIENYCDSWSENRIVWSISISILTLGAPLLFFTIFWVLQLGMLWWICCELVVDASTATFRIRPFLMIGRSAEVQLSTLEIIERYSHDNTHSCVRCFVFLAKNASESISSICRQWSKANCIDLRNNCFHKDLSPMKFHSNNRWIQLYSARFKPTIKLNSSIQTRCGEHRVVSPSHRQFALLNNHSFHSRSRKKATKSPNDRRSVLCVRIYSIITILIRPLGSQRAHLLCKVEWMVRAWTKPDRHNHARSSPSTHTSPRNWELVVLCKPTFSAYAYVEKLSRGMGHVHEVFFFSGGDSIISKHAGKALAHKMCAT